MHGIIYTELQRFIQQSLGAEAWTKALRIANLRDRSYMSLSDYPDEEMFAIVEGASEIAGKSKAETIEAFGTFIAPDLLRMYSVLIRPEWKTLDILEHTEAVVHTVVRVNQPGSKPPELKCKRLGPDEVELCYDSPRRLCGLARGIINGIAYKYQETIEIVEYECMHRGASACLMHVRNTHRTNRGLT
jgi:heme-NO-binding protein